MPTTFTATPQPTNNPPRTLLQLTYTGETTATITRADPDGVVRTVRLADPATLTGGSWTGFDYESWFGQSTTYTATVGGGGTITTAASTLSVSQVWMRHPGVPSLSMPIDFQGEGQPVRPVNQAILEPLNRPTPIVVTDGRRRAKRGTLTVRTKTDSEAAAWLALLDDTTVLLLDIPPNIPFGITAHQYVSLGDLTEDRLRPDYYPHPWRIWSVPFVVVDAPAGGQQAQRTYATVLAAFATYTAVKARYSTYNNLLTGT